MHTLRNILMQAIVCFTIEVQDSIKIAILNGMGAVLTAENNSVMLPQTELLSLLYQSSTALAGIQNVVAYVQKSAPL